MISKADPKAKTVLRDSPICLVNDLNPFMSGQTISYMELCQGMIGSRIIAKDIYEPVASVQKQTSFDALKEIALE